MIDCVYRKIKLNIKHCLYQAQLNLGTKNTYFLKKDLSPAGICRQFPDGQNNLACLH